MLNVFQTDAFSVVNLTASINKLPYVPSRVGSMGLFTPKGVRTTKIVVEERHGSLYLLPTKARGARGTTRHRAAKYGRVFQVPHIPHDTAIMADDIQNVRAFGSEDELEAITTVVNDELQEMRQAHEVTWEWHKLGALKGVILDADGTSEIYDLFDEFGLTQTSVGFDFDIVTTGYLKGKALAVKRAMQDALGGTPYKTIHAFCGNDFFDHFVGHAEVRESYETVNNNQFAREQQDGETGFEWGGITWENYRGGIGAVDFIDADKAHFFPLGVLDLFQHISAPGDFMEAVNTIGKPMYAKQQNMKFDKGVEIHTQSNPLMMCVRPMCLIEGTDDTTP